jgi:hypothetical protein
MRSIVLGNPGEGPQLSRKIVTPHPICKIDLSLRALRDRYRKGPHRALYLIHPVASADASTGMPFVRASSAIALWS